MFYVNSTSIKNIYIIKSKATYIRNKMQKGMSDKMSLHPFTFCSCHLIFF